MPLQTSRLQACLVCCRDQSQTPRAMGTPLEGACVLSGAALLCLPHALPLGLLRSQQSTLPSHEGSLRAS